MKVRLATVFDAITFDELAAYGRRVGAHTILNMPESFTYKGHAVTLESDDCFLVPAVGRASYRFKRGEVLVEMDDQLVPYTAEDFAKDFTLVRE